MQSFWDGQEFVVQGVAEGQYVWIVVSKEQVSKCSKSGTE